VFLATPEDDGVLEFLVLEICLSCFVSTRQPGGSEPMSMLQLANPRASGHPWSWSVVLGKIFFMPALAIELNESLTCRYRLVAIKFVRSEAKRDTLPLCQSINSVSRMAWEAMIG
jgi:hypothetical protein